MKKTIASMALLAALALAGAANAQIIINAGFMNKNASVRTTKVSNDSTYDDFRNIGKGYYIGMGYNYVVWKDFGVALGVGYNYTEHNESYSETYGSVKYDYTAWLNTKDLNIPLLITYNRELFPEFFVSGYFGPVFQLGLSAVGERTRVSGDEKEVTPLDYYAKDDEGVSKWTKYDLGFMVGTGVQYYGARFDIGYNFGILERSGEGIKDGKYESILMGQFFVGIGYGFDPFIKKRR